MEELTPEEKIILYRKRQQIRDRIKSWNDSVPEAFRGYDLDTLLEGRVNGNIPAAAVIDIRNWMKNPTPFLLLHGPSGLGKTLVGFLIAGEMLSQGVVGTARYIPATRLLDGLSDYSDREEGGALARSKHPELLLLDDLGSGGMDMSQARRTGLWELIDYRWSTGKHTIITTNLATTEMVDVKSPDFTVEDYIGNSAWDRMTDKRVDIPFHGETSRKKGDMTVEEKRRLRKEKREQRWSRQ